MRPRIPYHSIRYTFLANLPAPFADKHQNNHHAPPATPNITSLNISLPEDPINELEGDALYEKVHIRGLDNFSTDDVKRFASEHFSTDQLVRVEWVDDTSANFIFESADVAEQALLAFATEEILSLTNSSIAPLQLRPAKRLSTHPAIDLFVRTGSTIDVKRKNAAVASRYYLMNPKQDPRERREGRPKGRRYSDEDGEYNRRRFDDQEHKRRREDNNEFDVNMYDDDAGGDTERKRPRKERNGDLFADRVNRSNGGRLRDRSASPGWERSRNSRQRSASPRRNVGKELFPTIGKAPKELFLQTSNKGGDLVSSSMPDAPKDLFPEKQTATGAMRMDVFPNKRASFSNHRRNHAVDASALNSNAEYYRSTPPPRERALADRIGARPASAQGTPDDIRIRGASNNGFSIRGAAAQVNVKELFPLKAGSNVGKELFGEKIQGRGGPRRKAEDMFG